MANGVEWNTISRTSSKLLPVLLDTLAPRNTRMTVLLPEPMARRASVRLSVRQNAAGNS